MTDDKKMTFEEFLTPEMMRAYLRKAVRDGVVIERGFNKDGEMLYRATGKAFKPGDLLPEDFLPSTEKKQ